MGGGPAPPGPSVGPAILAEEARRAIPLCSSRVIIPGQGSGRATTTTQLQAGGRNGISYVHGHAVPWVWPLSACPITVYSTLPEWRFPATGTYMQIRQIRWMPEYSGADL